ncbi:hypothetical protein SRABI70_01569 [Pseudomonas sp. Bi70]|uniref:polysaccharide pyruvyl transferase family protein n=1 Tax=Pseudomonas sp. Bi70 TaxID=2821127 RepID=UPI001D773619|nr:polysaccharide pyruvyl transferase family protein [Pseudomonas sp. Bi70]CAH0193634.1 hypothetical protein SRABI70_01569 [Pseudomonas sp. Bi70]
MLTAILFNDTSHNKHHGCQIVVRQIYALAQEAGIRIVKACSLHCDWRRDEGLKREMTKVDLCLINGEGTLHDDAKAARILVDLAPFCRERNVPCYLINSVWQRNSMELTEAARSFSGIYVRDHHSQAELAHSGVASEVVPDLTLSAVPPAVTPREGLLVNGSFYEERTREAWHLYRDAGGAVQYVSIQSMPQIQWGKGFARYFWRSLRSFFKAFRARYKARRMGDFERDLPVKQIKAMRWRYSIATSAQFLQRLASSRGVITGRFHCVTLCLLSETPFFAIASNTHKIEGLLDQCGLSGRIFADYSSAYSSAQRIDFTTEELQAVRHFVSDSAARARQMFLQIAQTVRTQA